MNVPLLTIENVSKSFRGLKALRSISLEIEPGQIVGIIGPNGAGKTTLFNLISGNLAPDDGRLEFQGHSLLGLKPHQICRLGIARTFQIVKPFGNLTVLENVVVGCFNRSPEPAKAEEKAWSILEFTGLEGKAMAPANNLTTPERKRLEMARALATGPSLLLLDEVMAGLNPIEKDEVIDHVRRIRESGVTILVIEHALRVIMGLSDKIAVLNYGQLIAYGERQSVCSDPAVAEAYLGKDYVSAQRR